MQKAVYGLMAASMMSLLAPSAGAFWLDAFCEHCRDGYHKNDHWPSPYLCPDRVYAHAPFNTMVRNGWRRQNLLGAHHFTADGSKLTQAGELKVRWIMTQAPAAYRRVFVEQSMTAEATQTRIATVNSFATDVASNAGPILAGGAPIAPPQVSATHIVSEGRPAQMVDFVSNQFRENMRAPVLPAATQGAGGAQ